jgi:uncharacterized protein (TIGR00251 family)
VGVVPELFDIEGDGVVVLRVHAQPGAGRSAVTGRHGAAVKVRVAAPPERGRANEACRELLAETFGVPPTAITLVSGDSSRLKRFRIEGVDVDDFRRRLGRIVEGGNADVGPAVERRQPT